MIRRLSVCLIFLICGVVGFSQTVDVKVATSKKEIEAILRKARSETRANKAYFAEDAKCRNLVKTREWVKAELSCRRAISLVEKLPMQHVLERSSSRLALAVTLLWRKKLEEAISLIHKSIQIGKSIIDDSDAEMGERYFLLGQAHHLRNNIDEAVSFYLKAENTYRTAFKKMGDSDIRGFYPKPIVNILEAHLVLLQNSGRTDAASIVEKRLVKTRVEFAEFLNT